MASLDDKLRGIIGNGYDRFDVEKAIAQIKQAFADEGWIKPEGADLIADVLDDMMTGQEWYDRFMKELPDSIDLVHPDREVFDRRWAITAAKKAAGLTDDKL